MCETMSPQYKLVNKRAIHSHANRYKRLIHGHGYNKDTVRLQITIDRFLPERND